MPVLTQLNLNVGTEQNPNMVLHDLHDIRISSTDVTTVTRLLGCDAGVNSIAPLTLANAASLLGDAAKKVLSTDWSNLYGSGLYYLYGDNTVYTQNRYALVAVNLTSQGYDLVVIGTSSDFGDSGAYNLIYQITNNGVQFKKGSGLPCYLIKLV